MTDSTCSGDSLGRLARSLPTGHARAARRALIGCSILRACLHFQSLAGPVSENLSGTCGAGPSPGDNEERTRAPVVKGGNRDESLAI